MTPRVVCWFSCGAASAVATKLALDESPDAVIAYCDTGSEHLDNVRFLRDCERWYDRPIIRLRSPKYADIWDVFAQTRFLVGPNGARCSTELKKLVRRDFERPDDRQVFGFTVEEQDRAARFAANNPEIDASYPLIEHDYGKTLCYSVLTAAGIELPEMYRLGYHNNNCIGCVKGQSGYWNKVRRDFPAVFARMAAVERDLNVAINKTYAGDGTRQRVFLDELPPEAGRHTDLAFSCGLFCGEI